LWRLRPSRAVVRHDNTTRDISAELLEHLARIYRAGLG